MVIMVGHNPYLSCDAITSSATVIWLERKADKPVCHSHSICPLYITPCNSLVG